MRDLHSGMGLAGLITSVAVEELAASAFPFASTVADNDAYAACIGAFAGGSGGIVIAGTGSIGFALVNGERYMVGGWGFSLGDHGSGAWLGHHAVRRAALAIDGLLQPTPLIDWSSRPWAVTACISHSGRSTRSRRTTPNSGTWFSRLPPAAMFTA